jgi:hypothetical protein
MLTAFNIRMQKRIFGLKRQEITGRGRKWHKEELHSLCSSPNDIRWSDEGRSNCWVCRMHGEKKNACTNLVRNSERKSLLLKSVSR